MNHEIYADHAATAPIEPLALEAMYTAYQEYANPAALYRSALHTKQTVEKARLTVAENLGCTPDHIFFTSGGSESNTWAIRGTVPQGGHVVTTPIEHHSVLNACASIRDDGGRMTTLEVDGFGRVVPESLTRALAAHPNLVSLQYANNEVGVVQNIPALAALCREADVLLHVGLGTFRPVSAENVEEHHMHSEYYEMSEESAQRINRARQNGGRIIAVGTTSCRTLESVADESGVVHAKSGYTDIFITPGYRFKAVDGLITNFHLPESTLIMLVSAFAGYDNVMNAYNTAVKERYRFFSFGDCCLFL